VSPPSGGTSLRARLAAAARHPRVQTGGETFASQGGALLVNLLTGVLAARVLGTAGRGELVAVMTAAQVVAWAFAMGAGAAASYHQARRPEDAPRLLATWFVLTAGLGALGAAAGELLLPVILDAQSDATLDAARLYMLSVILLVFVEFMYGFMLGAHRFRYFNVARAAIPATIALAYLGLWGLDELTVDSALVAVVAVNLGAAVLTAVVAIAEHGLGRPSLALARTTLWYGLRAHSAMLTGLVNTRIDLFVMPAFLSASSIGLYSVATNVSWIVASVPGSLGAVVLPWIARDRAGAERTVVQSLAGALLVALAIATVIAVFAPQLIRLLYGAEFADAVTPLRLLLPGSVLYAGTFVVMSGLYARDRPLTAGLTQLVSVVITAAGLVLFLESGGTKAAALVTSAAYAIGFLLAVAAYRHVTGIRWRDLLPGRLPAPEP
jgi:O-antigen/teichoic acid export membrane protein